MAVQLSSAKELPVSIDVCPAFLSRELPVTLVSVQPSSAKELPVSIGVCPAFLSKRAWCLSSLPHQKRFPVSIGVCPAFLSRRAPGKHWCLSSQKALISVQPSSAEELPSKHWYLSSLPQQKSFPVSIDV